MFLPMVLARKINLWQVKLEVWFVWSRTVFTRIFMHVWQHSASIEVVQDKVSWQPRALDLWILLVARWSHENFTYKIYTLMVYRRSLGELHSNMENGMVVLSYQNWSSLKFVWPNWFWQKTIKTDPLEYFHCQNWSLFAKLSTPVGPLLASYLLELVTHKSGTLLMCVYGCMHRCIRSYVGIS